jgi:hypothetical protein
MNLEGYCEDELAILYARNTRYCISALASTMIAICQPIDSWFLGGFKCESQPQQILKSVMDPAVPFLWHGEGRIRSIRFKDIRTSKSATPNFND